VRGAVVDFVHCWSLKIPISQQQILNWIGMRTSKFYDWEQRYGQRKQHNASLPRGQWLEQWEKEAILDYYNQHSQEGYRRLSLLMLDDDVIAVSPSSVYRVQKRAER
jgi:putative transposase